MKLLFTWIIFFILGIFAFLFGEYLYFKYSKIQKDFIFTEGISTDIITWTKNYQELLTARLGLNDPYFISYGEKSIYILPKYWTVFDIKTWLESLNDKDYVLIIELILKNTEELPKNDYRIVLSSEFMVNNHSNPNLISTLISNQLEKVYNMFNSKKDDNHYVLIHVIELIPSK
jgi:hypothetical protein